MQYYGLVISQEVRNVLLGALSELTEYKTVLESSERVIIHHCTVLHISQVEKNPEILSFCESHEGLAFEGSVIAIGYSDKAMAFRVEFPGVTIANRMPHITISVMNGGCPVDSNYISQWEDLAEPIKVSATLTRV